MEKVLATRKKCQSKVKLSITLTCVAALLLAIIPFMALGDKSIAIRIVVGVLTAVVIIGLSIPGILIDEKKQKAIRSYPDEAIVLRDDAIYIITDHEEKILLSRIKKVAAFNDTKDNGYIVTEYKSGKIIISTDKQKYVVPNINDVADVKDEINKLLNK